MRIRKVLSNIIQCSQTAYVNDRYIGESIRLISDVLEYTDKHDIEGILFSADFEKAFDSIEHNFLFATLKSFGFGPQFIQWIRTIFKNPESCVMNNGHSTGYFNLQRGTRQIKNGMITITKRPNKIERKQPRSPRKKSQSQNKKLREN